MASSLEKATSGVLRNAAALLDEMQLMGETQGSKKVTINSELWHACAGPLVCLPQRGSLVYYFPQGHSEQVAATTRKTPNSRIPNYPSLSSQLLCQAHNITLHADKETDEIYAQMTLQPVHSETDVFPIPTLGAYTKSKHPTEYFCKNLTASDTSTHGGFSVPRRAAEKLFPQLDYSMQPPNQELIVRDLHDNTWTFRHIYRGQPKRHLLTTGWSLFVGAKRLKAGDSVLFIRDEKSQLLVGVRRAIRQQSALSSSVLSTDSMHIGVLAAAAHAASSGGSFTIYYNPRTSPSPFVIPLARYNKATYMQPSVGMRFAMMFETEESSKRRCTGTIVGISDYDPIRWPNSKWRNLQVEWDEHGYGERPERVSIWDIETPENSLVFSSPSLNSKRQCLPSYGVPGLQVGYANMPVIPRAQGNPYGDFQHMPTIGSELALMLLNQSGQNLGNTLNCHQSSFSSIIQNVKHSYIPPSTFGTSIGSIKQEARPSNETQQQLSTPNIQRGEQESYEVQPGIDSIPTQELNAAREPRNADSFSSQSISGQNSKGEPRNKTRRSKKGSSRKTISDKSELSSVPSQICDDQLHGSEAKVEAEQANSGNKEDSSGTLSRGNFAGDLHVQQVEQHGMSAPKLESSKSPDGGKSVSSLPNQGCFSQFFEGLDWMTQSSYYQDSNGIQSVSASENIFNSSVDMPSTINGDTMEAFQNSCLSDYFPSSIQEFISSPELNSLSFLSPEMQHLDVQHDGSNLPSTSNSYVQMSFSESGNQSASLSGLHMDAIHISVNNSSCSQPLTTGSFDAGVFSKLPNVKESQVLPLPEIHDSSMGTPSCSMDAAEYSIDRSMKPMKPPVRTYTKVQKVGSVGRSIDVTRFRGYHELRSAIACMFGLQGKLEHPGSSDWKLVYVDYENDVLLVGDDPWEEFINCVRCIRILSPSEVQQMSENGVHVLNDCIQIAYCQTNIPFDNGELPSFLLLDEDRAAIKQRPSSPARPKPTVQTRTYRPNCEASPASAKGVAIQDAKIGSETPAADGVGDAGRKRPSGGDGPTPPPSDKRRRPEPPSSSGSRERHHRRASSAEEKVRASHILIKHEGSRRKASWRDPEGVAISATTRDDAADLVLALREQIVSGERKFEDVAAENSDCNSAKRGGDLGSFGRGKMQKPFEKAAFALKVGEISDVVDTESGVHIIKRTG